MLEVHPDPDRALSDGQQSLRFDEYERLAKDLRELREWMQKRGRP